MTDIKKNLDIAGLRKFGLIFALILSVLSWLSFRKHNPGFVYFYYSSLTIFLLALFIPRSLIPLNRILVSIGHIVGKINTTIIFSVIFYIIFAPVGFFCRIFRIDLLDEAPDKKASTYWKDRPAITKTKENYERLY